ncbi:MAG: TonB-dependent receptor [Alphaproteobacteria bacterium]|nr:TonB-dependent receptor [Alphaproteobacteria bacterium]MBU0793105.1 TonB-dependent receptor [Alphaproteobacteria bacterium]MBU0876903.1 TonB-dependent receptor [Alphaproteobacteria bacterium]MBU1771119.1 TonB-dependent receptor [Alphaproteobacteria bacterium]
MKRRKFAAILLLASAAIPATALAQTEGAPQDGAETGGEIIVTGTRASGMMAADSATPIQLLSDSALEKVGQPNLNQALTQLVPSFQAQSQGTDMASFSLSARLRGVSPNHTLVMVNGKRRHGNSILQVINGAFGGSAAPSIDLIPPDIVQRIEILQDGAAAQYGSDAIAGVINIILKSDTSGVTIKGTAGEYFDGEGMTYSGSGNIGLPIGDAGFLDIALFHRRNDYTTIGEGQFTAVNLDGSTNTSVSPAFKPIYDALNARNGTAAINGGQPKSMLNVGFYNFGYDFGGVEFYSFGDVSYRHGDALQGFRPPNRVCVSSADPTTCYAPTVENGMVPHIEVKQEEFSLTNGVRGDLGGFDWDLGVSYAEDIARVYTTRSANASLFVATGFTPRDFYDGSFKYTQFVTTLDLRKELEVGLAEPMTLAVGGEYRKETYEIGAGDEGSRYVEGGQSFPGFALSDASSLKRNAKAIYGNVIVRPVSDWTVDIAGRFENYSDFGDTTIGKITTRYDFSPAFAIRATASTGFRAPSLPEAGYSATNVGPTSAVIQLAPGSAGALSAGFGALTPEKSTNFSAGFVARPIPGLVVTLDGYYIKIKDRIVSSGNITGQRSQPFPTPGIKVGIDVPADTINGLTPYDLVNNAIIASGKMLDPTVMQSGQLSIQTFTNGIDTETWGLELAARYPVDLDFGRLDLSLGANYNKNKVIANRLGDLFNLQAQAIIEKASPDFKSVASALFTTGAFSANLRATYYSETVALVQPNGFSTTPRPIAGTYYEGIVKPAVIFDLELGYDVMEWFNIAVGANNLFDKKPEVPDLVADYDPVARPGWLAGRSPYVNNSGSINAPYNHGPYGSNGGYYYARVTFKF